MTYEGIVNIHIPFFLLSIFSDLLDFRTFKIEYWSSIKIEFSIPGILKLIYYIL